MPQVIFAAAAVEDLARLSDFLHQKHPVAAKLASAAIIKAVKILSDYPQAGRPDDDNTEYRELIIDFGNSGYTAKYHYKNDLVTVVKIKHQKEAGYF